AGYTERERRDDTLALPGKDQPRCPDARLNTANPGSRVGRVASVRSAARETARSVTEQSPRPVSPDCCNRTGPAALATRVTAYLRVQSCGAWTLRPGGSPAGAGATCCARWHRWQYMGYHETCASTRTAEGGPGQSRSAVPGLNLLAACPRLPT